MDPKDAEKNNTGSDRRNPPVPNVSSNDTDFAMYPGAEGSRKCPLKMGAVQNWKWHPELQNLGLRPDELAKFVRDMI